MEIYDGSDTASVDVDEVDEFDDVYGATIAKPPGEAGRPESGGYNLEAAVKLGPHEFGQLKVTFQSLCILSVSQPCCRNAPLNLLGTCWTIRSVIVSKLVVF